MDCNNGCSITTEMEQFQRRGVDQKEILKNKNELLKEKKNKSSFELRNSVPICKLHILSRTTFNND
jgi:hypothetical protein